MKTILAWLLILASAVRAEVVLTPESAARLALEKNSELQAARLIVAEAEARARTTGRLANPELNAEFAGGQDLEGKAEVGLTQRFPLTSRLRWERKRSALEIEMARLEVAARERQLAAQTQSACVELAAAREALAQADRQAKIAGALADSLASQAREGQASGLESSQGALAAQEILLEQAELRATEAAATSRLATLLGLTAETRFALPALALPKNLPSDTSLADRPEIRLAETAVAAGDAEVFLAQASRWEDIGVGLFVEGERNRDEPEGVTPEGFLGMRVSIPLPLWQNGSGRVKEKQAGRERLERQLAALRLAAGNEAVAARRTMQAHYETARRAATQIVPAARRQLDDSESAYQRGETDVQQVFRARERLAALERASLEANKAFHLARIAWLAATGGSLLKP